MFLQIRWNSSSKQQL